MNIPLVDIHFSSLRRWVLRLMALLRPWFRGPRKRATLPSLGRGGCDQVAGQP
jgi:hypothetical protein